MSKLKTMYPMIVSKESNNFGDIIYTVQFETGQIDRLIYSEGNWPDALQLHNDLKRLNKEVIGE